MNFIKTFLITLVIYLGLNVIFAMIFVFTLPVTLPDAGILIVAMMFGPITTSPGVAWVDQGIIALIQSGMTDPLTVTLMFLYYVLPPILAVIVGGLLADSTTIAFGSWFLTAIISTAVYTIIMGAAGSNPAISPTLYFTVYINLWFLYGPTDLYLAMILFGLLNTFLYGCISFLVTRKKL